MCSDEPAGDSTAIITEARRCITCSYHLQGLPARGVCPECGTDLALSLRDNLLINSSPGYLATIHQGVFLVQAAIIVAIIGFLLLIFGGMGVALLSAGGGAGISQTTVTLALTVLGVVFSVIPSLIGLLGWWKFSEPDPRASETDRGENPRRVVRVTVVVEVSVLIASQTATLILELIGRPSALPAGATPASMLAVGLEVTYFLLLVASFIAMAVRFFASMLYLRWLTPRIPNEKAFNRARRLMWLGPLLCTVGAMACYIGPLVALILYYNLLDWVRVDVKRLRKAAAHLDGPAGPAPMAAR